ncbi:MAG: hypothetical protein FJ088_02730 [Deltaproteobacteria bacterium]|nr:hypothetical protein [Deltaproteobacteria bacterium]
MVQSEAPVPVTQQAPVKETPKESAMPDDDVHRQTMMQKGGMAAGIPANQTDGNAIPLKKDGIGSAAELQKSLETIKDAGAKKMFEEAFRLGFSANRGMRDYLKAGELFEKVASIEKDCAPAYRGLAFVAVNSNFNEAKAIELYEKAVSIKADYGEAHYALAFMYGMKDPDKGKKHFEKAMELKIPDEQGLEKMFYGK